MSRRARSMLAFVPTLAGLIAGGAWHARADTPAPVVAQQTPPTTVAPNLLESLLQKLFPTTTTVPPAKPAAPSPPQATPDEAPSDPANPAAAAAGEDHDHNVPPEAYAIINSVVRTGSNNNLALLAALRPLLDQGLTEEEAALIGMGQFPVAGETYWSDDWYMPRFTPTFHLHQGTDLFAARGTPVRAPVDGSVQYASEGAGGLAAYVTGADGTYYYMAHLESFARDLSSGSRVKQGQVVGFVGSSGNAVGGAPHVHFEIHPGGGGPINPKATVDRWVAEAVASVPKVLAPYQVGLPRPLTAAGMLRRLDAGSLGGPKSTDGPRLWAASIRRDKASVRLTTVASGGGEARWDPREDAKALDRVRAQQLAQTLLDPLTPRVMAGRTGGG